VNLARAPRRAGAEGQIITSHETCSSFAALREFSRRLSHPIKGKADRGEVCEIGGPGERFHDDLGRATRPRSAAVALRLRFGDLQLVHRARTT